MPLFVLYIFLLFITLFVKNMLLCSVVFA